jgi:hypothetical protein
MIKILSAGEEEVEDRISVAR